MFENFRLLFIYAFQINAALLYLVPLTLRLHGEPMLLAASLTALMAVFKSYPSLGDVGFYLALLPMWKHLFNCEFWYICSIDMSLAIIYVLIYWNYLISWSYRYAARVCCWLFLPYYLCDGSYCMASVDLFTICKCKLLLWSYTCICDCSSKYEIHSLGKLENPFLISSGALYSIILIVSPNNMVALVTLQLWFCH